MLRYQKKRDITAIKVSRRTNYDYKEGVKIREDEKVIFLKKRRGPISTFSRELIPNLYSIHPYLYICKLFINS